LIAGSNCPNAKLQVRVGQNSFRFEPILAHDIRDFYFRATQREIDGSSYPEKKNHRDRDNDSDAAED
jgi:hypothetical protein